MNKNKDKKNLAVLGAGNMGTVIAQVLAENGHQVNLWNWEGDQDPLKQIEKYKENKKYLPGVKLSANIKPCFKIELALEKASMVFFVVPSGVMEHTVSFAARSIKNKAILINVSKGLDPDTLSSMTSLIVKHVRPELKRNIMAISGPAVANQIALHQYTAMNVTGRKLSNMKKIMKVMNNDYVKLVPCNDVIGVEIGGSLKNVYTIAIGMCDSLGYGLNTKAALLTFAIREIADLIQAMGGRRQTAYELAGIGDLIGTSLCHDSRNRTFGEYLGKNLTKEQAIKKVKQVVEGVGATECLVRLAQKHKVSVPFAEMIYQCLESKKNPGKIFEAFLQKL